jgi:polysaccharide export outer membrane protein
MLALVAMCCAVAGAFCPAFPVTADDSAAGNQVQAPTGGAVADANYQIQVEDILRLDVWGEPQLSNLQTQVTPDGKINIAYIGEVQAEGLTQSELTASIAKKLESAEILLDPNVQITILTLHRPTVRVLGAVQRSGEFIFRDGDRILDAVAQAGYTDNAWLEKGTLIHSGPNQQPIPIDLKKMLDGDLSQNFELQKGDVINIPPEDYANKFYVMGQVLRPMMYDLKDKATVLAAINLAGGPTERASLRSTVVIRGDPAKPEKVNCDLSKLFDKGDLSQDIVLQPGDVVYVPETKKPHWGKISQILSTITSLTYIRRFGLF